MAQARGSARRSRTQRSGSDRSRRPERVRGAGSARAKLRAGFRSARVTEAARALGLSTTRRAAVAAIVVCALAFTLAVPLRTYLAQQAAVAEQEALRGQLTDRVTKLEQQKAELADPAQVEAEARRRLRYVMPGETPYIVQLPEDSADAQELAAAERAERSGAWYERLWSNVAG
ncbi:MAG: FtsB family cell division protein [Pseudonocardiaceae bacterium]